MTNKYTVPSSGFIKLIGNSETKGGIEQALNPRTNSSLSRRDVIIDDQQHFNISYGTTIRS